MLLTGLRAYGDLIYYLPKRYAFIRRPTMVLATIGPGLAKLEGQLTFEEGVVLDVWKLGHSDRRRITKYSYEVCCSDKSPAGTIPSNPRLSLRSSASTPPQGYA